MSIASPFVWYQESSHNGTNVTFSSSPAIVTSRQLKRMPLRYAADEPFTDALGQLPGSVSFRAIDADVPKVTLNPPSQA